ncbi:MurR/RpiR family transcriptional regulator [Anaerobacterium chartisolvens]|uniref:MurR/RpiR family transcriptional regulator n=1 Tax=Anaerobacterium chartisolvens TaxID=1297424 RepID=UPI001FA87189|nr:MurR/RpiR family transcriptional regulator [Anaerobacterium chartisolvens]
MKIKESLSGLTKKEKLVAKYVLQFPHDVPKMSIQELAAASGTSPSSVVRLCKSLGYSGYKEFCRLLTADISANRQDDIVYEDVRPGDSLPSIAKSVVMSNIRAIESSLQILNVDQLEQAVTAICQADRVDFYGVGTSCLVALDAHSKFLRINKHSNVSEDPHVQVLSAATLKKGDVAVIISYSGETRDVLIIADIIKKTSATIIAITKYGKNPLNTQADINLYTYSTENLIRSGAMSSRISQLTIIDILYTAVASNNYGSVKPHLDKSLFAAGRMRSSK